MSPGFSMRGSGVDALEYSRSFDCNEENCNHEQEVEFSSEDTSGKIDWVCDKCKSENRSSFELSDEIDPDVNFYD